MKSRWIINSLIMIAIVALTLIARYEPGIEAPAGPQPITGLEIDQVEHIRVNRPLREDLTLTRNSNGSWSLDHDPTLPADSFQVRALAKMAQHPAVRSYPAAELELSRLALDPPYASVTLNDTRIDFGSLEPLEELRYVRVGEQVHLVSDMFMHLIDADPVQFARRRLFAESDRIDLLELPGITLRKDDGKWSTDPQQPVSADALQQLVDSWQQASAIYLRAADDSDVAETVTVRLENPQRIVAFGVVSHEPELRLRRLDYHIDYRMGSLAAALLKLPQAAAQTPQ